MMYKLDATQRDDDIDAGARVPSLEWKGWLYQEIWNPPRLA